MVTDLATAPDELKTADRLDLLERSGDPDLTAITRLAAYVTGAGAAAVHVFDSEHQRRIAAAGTQLGEHPRGDSMCRLVVDSAQRIVCADASLDPRFGYSSFVTGPGRVRFYVSVPLRSSDGSVLGTLCAFDTVRREISARQLSLLEDLAEQVVARIELIGMAVALGRAACHDPLTGAVNRLVLGDRLAQAFARRQRAGGRTFVGLLDVDAFKAINDRHGHATGDAVLVAVAERCRQALRAHDTVARLGGDEFMVVAELDAGSAIGRAELIERLSVALCRPVTVGEHRLPVSVSIGGTFAEPGEEIRTLLARADQAMYAAKRAAA